MPQKKKPSSSDDARACGNCERLAPTMFGCARCGLVYYCGKDCQIAHWKDHKPLCIPKADRVPQAPRSPGTQEPAKQDQEECAICLDSLAEDGSTLALPCGHAFHGSCVEGLRAQGAAKVCPLCRGELPAGPDQLFDEATRRFVAVEARVERLKTSWGALRAADQREMKEVVLLWKNAAAQGSAEAAFNLGIIHKHGRGVLQDFAEAVKWYRRAAEQGYARAQTNLGLMYDKGQGVQQNSAEAVKWFRRGVEQGYARAQHYLGAMYNKGEGVQQNFAEAVKLYRRAAEQGYAEAQSNLGISYASGKGVQQDFVMAIKWSLKAAEQGYVGAQFNLGAAYYNGQGVQQDNSKAAFWFEKAASQGCDQAKEILKEFRLFQDRDTSAALPPASSSDAQGACANCTARATSGTSLKSCSRCGTVFYCSRDCQLADWKAGHKKSCKAHKGT